MTRNLHHDHDELRAIMRRFALVLDQGPEAFEASLHRERVQFSQLFRSHMADEEAIARRSLGNHPLLVQGRTDLQALFGDYSAHIAAWTPQRIKTEWADYRKAVLALQRRLTGRMDWEERHLHPLLSERDAA